MLLTALLAPPALAQRIGLPRPGPREFILDKANLLTPADRETIRAICDGLLTDKATPVIVVTIDSMADHGGGDLRIETFATLLFDQWHGKRLTPLLPSTPEDRNEIATSLVTID
jgi:uncharacterized protein